MNKSSKKPLSREELVERLRAIAADDTPREVSYGAMCYSPMSPVELHTPCEACGCDIKYMGYEYDAIMPIVAEMQSLGYDVKVSIVCESCAEKLTKELRSNADQGCDCDVYPWIGDINHVFYFRLSPDVEYHRAITNSYCQYKALLALLKNMPMYGGNYDESHYLADEIETLEYMTGIKFDV